MTIWFQCPDGHYLGVDQRYAGRRVRCGGCGKLVYVPGRPPPVKRKMEDPRESLPPAKSAAIPAPAVPVQDRPGLPPRVKEEHVEAVSAVPPKPEAPIAAPPHPGPLPTVEAEQLLAAPVAAPPHPGSLPVGEREQTPAAPVAVPPHPGPLPAGEGEQSLAAPARPGPLPEVTGERVLQQAVRPVRRTSDLTPPSAWSTVIDYWLRRSPCSLPHDVERVDREKRMWSYRLSAMLSLAVVLSLVPVVWRGNLNLAVAPGWSRAIMLAAGLQLIYIGWTLNAPDWASARVLTTIFALAAAFYAAVLAIAMFRRADHPMPLGFGGDRRMAMLLSFVELAIMAGAAGLAGWVSLGWRRSCPPQSARRALL
jgi:hypothetical protein